MLTSSDHSPLSGMGLVRSYNKLPSNICSVAGEITLTSFIHSVLEFQSAVQLGSTPESLMLEFKAKIDGWNAAAGNVRKKAQKETCRDIAQFANTL